MEVPTLVQLRHNKASALARSRGKKWEAVFKMPNGRCRSITFGAEGASDFTIHKDPVRWSLSLRRHGAAAPEDKPASFWQKLSQQSSTSLSRRHGWALQSYKEHWDEPVSPGALSRFILWNKPDFTQSLRDAIQYFTSKKMLCVPDVGVRVVLGRASDHPGVPKFVHA